MAISPPSDLVLDVVRAADPAQVQAAQERLAANRAAFRASSLADAGKGFGAMLDQANSASFDAGVRHSSNPKINPADVPKAYREMEGVFLQNFMKSMMPEDSEDVYGTGLAGDMWKGMAADQLGSVLAQGRGVGIAEQMFAQALMRERAAGAESAGNDHERQAAEALVTDLQRRTFGLSVDENEKTSRA